MIRRRPTLSDQLMFIAARAHSGRVFNQFIAATRRATRLQERVLLAKIRRNAESEFGRTFQFDSIRTSADFVRRVPILRYEDHLPYIERVKSGDTRAMFGSGERVLMFALTSGTSCEPKHIPVTRSFLQEYRAGWNAFGVKALMDHPWGFLRPILQVSSRMDESRTEAGIPCGAITGLMAATQKRLVRKYYVASAEVARIDDPLAKYYTIMRLAVPGDVAFMITASPATQLKLARTADEHREQLIRDVRDGNLWEELPVPRDVRDSLAPRLTADPTAASDLEQLASEHGALLPKHYWELAFMANWTGGTMGLYLDEFPHYFGDTPIRDVGLLASEGRVSVPVENRTPAGILDVTSSFFEFVPKSEREAASPVTLRSHEVEVGEEYFVLMTTSSGLYRYDLGDLVRVVGFENEAPVIEFLNKGDHISSIAGEKLTEHQVIQAMAELRKRLNAPVANFVLAPCFDKLPYYVLHIEPGPHAAEDAAATLGHELDTLLGNVNMEYASKRQTHRLGQVRVNTLPDGYLTEFDRKQANLCRRGNEQYKHRFLYSKPGEDAAFPRHPRFKSEPGAPSSRVSLRTEN